MTSKFSVLIIFMLFIACATPTLLKIKALKKSLLFGGNVPSCTNCNQNYGRSSVYGYGSNAGLYNNRNGLGFGVQTYVSQAPIYNSGYGTYGRNGYASYGTGGRNGYGYSGNSGYGGYGYYNNADNYRYGAAKEYYGHGYTGGYHSGSLNRDSYAGGTFVASTGGVGFGSVPC